MKNIGLLTQKEYVAPKQPNPYVKNILLEDDLIIKEFREYPVQLQRINWDNQQVNWKDFDALIFRTTWDYFHRFQEFWAWLEKVRTEVELINDFSLIKWNIHKFYLRSLKEQGITIPPTLFLQKEIDDSLDQLVKNSHWEKCILKPAISGSARHTYLIEGQPSKEVSAIYNRLIKEEDLLLQEYQPSIQTKGEASLMLYNGNYSHAILKRAKEGDFRVQDDFGGTVHDFQPSMEDIRFAEAVVEVCPSLPVYARVDIFWNEEGKTMLGELELIEPEMWFRTDARSAARYASAIMRKL